MKLVHKLSLAFIVLVAVPIFVLGYFLSRTATAAIEHQTMDHLVAINRVKESEFDRWLSDNGMGLELLAARPTLRSQLAALVTEHHAAYSSEDPARIEQHGAEHKRLLDEHLRPYLREGAYLVLFILDPETGEILISTDREQEGLYRESQLYFLNGRNSTYTQNPYHSSRLETFVTTIGTPVISSEGELVAVLAGHLDLSEATKILSQGWDLSDTEDTYVVNPAGEFVTEPRFGGGHRLMQIAGSEGVERAIAEETGGATYTDYRGARVMGAYMWIAERELAIVTEMDLKEALGPVLRVRTSLLWAGSLTGGAAVVVAVILAGGLVRRTRRLVAATDAVGRGDLSHRVHVTSRDELGTLGAAFNAMAENLRVTTASRDELNREIEQRKSAEARLQGSLEEVERSNKELEQFAYVASHDLQEPLRMVSSYTQLLAQRYGEALDQDATDFIHYAVDGANRMQRLINDLLAYSRVQMRGNPFRPVNLNEVLGQARTNVGTAVEESGAIITNEELPTVVCDPVQMASVFLNLLSNAIKFRGAEPPRVHVSAIDRGNAWEFRVQDNGIGIAAEFHDRIFAIFQRLHARSDYPGTGMGLSLVKRIVERHGGTVGVDSEPGNGATFWFTLPKQQPGIGPDHSG